ncbi:MAG: hypothetical protein ACI9OJ_004545 [Myxococcota bacterium]|jgi:hypothetical protein
MGEIYLATLKREAGFERAVAVKRILPHLADDAAFVRMFEAEARLTARLNHPNIVHIYDFGKESGEAWIAMEFVDGFDLRTALELAAKAGIPFPTELAVAVAIDCARGLAYAHGLKGEGGGIIHRDISPQNILLSMAGETKLTDFGLAKTLAVESGSVSGMLKGKLAYMPPEQIRAEALGPTADIFALGAVLYEMVSARRLYPSGMSLAERVTNPRHEPLVAIGDVPSELAEIVERCLQPKAIDRFQSADELATRLRQVQRSPNPDALATWLSQFADRRKVVADRAVDGTVVARKPCAPPLAPVGVPLEETVAAKTLRPPEATVTGTPVVPAKPRSGSGRWLIGVAILVAAAIALALSSWEPSVPEVLVAKPLLSSVSPPVTVRVERPPPSAASEQRLARRLSIGVLPTRIIVAVDSADAVCFARNKLTEKQRAIRCGAAVELEPGPYRIAATLPGQDPVTLDVVLRTGQQETITLTTRIEKPLTCTVTVTAAAGTRSAKVVLDDGGPVDSPATFTDLAAGSHGLTASRPGYQTLTQTFVCDPDAPATLELALKPRQITVSVGGRRRVMSVGETWVETRSIGPFTATLRVKAQSNGVQIHLHTKPWATVSIGGRAVGDTPKRLRVKAGSKTISLSNGAKKGSLKIRVTD